MPQDLQAAMSALDAKVRVLKKEPPPLPRLRRRILAVERLFGWVAIFLFPLLAPPLFINLFGRGTGFAFVMMLCLILPFVLLLHGERTLQKYPRYAILGTALFGLRWTARRFEAHGSYRIDERDLELRARALAISFFVLLWSFLFLWFYVSLAHFQGGLWLPKSAVESGVVLIMLFTSAHQLPTNVLLWIDPDLSDNDA